MADSKEAKKTWTWTAIDKYKNHSQKEDPFLWSSFVVVAMNAAAVCIWCFQTKAKPVELKPLGHLEFTYSHAIRSLSRLVRPFPFFASLGANECPRDTARLRIQVEAHLLGYRLGLSLRKGKP